ncbi:MAG: cysteine hydrolase family protein [Pseudomonadota bacterium]
MKDALLIIDLQNDYFPGGAMELSGIIQAAANADALLKAYRQNHLPVIHIQHLSAASGSFFIPKTPGLEIHESVRPMAGEPLIQKHFPNSFRETGLLDLLTGSKIQQLTVCGAMSHMCIDATVRAGFDLGFRCRVVSDACATRDLVFDNHTVPAREVHGAFMAALASVYATPVTTLAVLRFFKPLDRTGKFL